MFSTKARTEIALFVRIVNGDFGFHGHFARQAKWRAKFQSKRKFETNDPKCQSKKSKYIIECSVLCEYFTKESEKENT